MLNKVKFTKFDNIKTFQECKEAGKNNPYWRDKPMEIQTQVLESAEKDIKIAIISVFHMFNKLRHRRYKQDSN